MHASQNLHFYFADLFIPIGTPLVITAISAQSENLRIAESYLFLFRHGADLVFRARRLAYRAIPKELVSDETLHNDALGAATAELEALTLEAATKHGRDVVPFTFKFRLEPCLCDLAFLALLRRKPVQQVRLIRDATECEELGKFLPTTLQMQHCQIQEDPLE